jgi:hypothetical protein
MRDTHVSYVWQYEFAPASLTRRARELGAAHRPRGVSRFPLKGVAARLLCRGSSPGLLQPPKEMRYGDLW